MVKPTTVVLLAILGLSKGFQSTVVVSRRQKIHDKQNARIREGRLNAVASATELPDSLPDAAERAAQATAAYCQQAGPLARCRVDFDTSAGDETFPILKSSTEFMQYFVTKTCLALIPNLQQSLQNEMMAVAQAKAELRDLINAPAAPAASAEANDDEESSEESAKEDAAAAKEKKESRMKELAALIENQGRPADYAWTGLKCRIYFPDEGNAALARRDWTDQVPPCVEFASCSGIQLADTSRDALIFFYCPKASESESVEEILQACEQSCDQLLLTCFVNPNLVDMGVTGFGMAGRLLRERLIDPLQYTYYLRTLQWGALTQCWPAPYSVWQEDANAEGGYKLLQTLDRLPSNPEVEDIYDIANGNMAEKQSGGMLDQLGDFTQGMMRL